MTRKQIKEQQIIRDFLLDEYMNSNAHMYDMTLARIAYNIDYIELYELIWEEIDVNQL